MYTNFKNLINQKGITPYQVSKSTGIPQATFSHWKHGRSNPKVDKLLKIATYLQVPIEELLKEEKDDDNCQQHTKSHL